MAFADRLPLIQKIEELRGSKVICYLTSLRPNVSAQNDHTIDDIIENMASRLYFHGHPINRREAKEDLRLKVATDVSQELEDAIWNLYRHYEEEFENLIAFYPPADLIPLATAQNPSPQGPVSKEYDLLMTVIESGRLSSKYTVRKCVSLLPMSQPGQPVQRVMWEDVLGQGWVHMPFPSTATQSPGQ